ncbi:Transcriptional regulator, LuxR family [Novosphingobium resinovorum]|uniref:Transcriptional regulator, LuxR family n=1 Tax=Novosphingobium resinovorum TaxID=158500 RepID=A0A031K4Q2_9SPHN|nr:MULTISPECIES: LuxR family transcriptional regulator [Novosphingobium]EZP83998.1 Transcriptional regulator, LuxR family [Novosphingobium resinovorum]
MPLERLIEQHRKYVRAARRDRDILSLTVDAVGELGFNRVALVQMVWFLRQERQYFCLDNYGEWHDIFIARQYYRRDPVHLASLRTNRCFAWSEVGAILGASRVHLPILQEAARHGLNRGLTVPIGVPGEPPGSGSLGTDAETLPPPDRCRAAAWIVDEAFAEVRRVYGLPAKAEDHAPPLSPRRLECLRLVALGLTDAEVAERMGIAISTVHTHMEYLRRTYGVRSRTQLGRLAQRLGLLGTEDIIP